MYLKKSKLHIPKFSRLNMTDTWSYVSAICIFFFVLNFRVGSYHSSFWYEALNEKFENGIIVHAYFELTLSRKNYFKASIVL